MQIKNRTSKCMRPILFNCRLNYANLCVSVHGCWRTPFGMKRWKGSFCLKKFVYFPSVGSWTDTTVKNPSSDIYPRKFPFVIFTLSKRVLAAQNKTLHLPLSFHIPFFPHLKQHDSLLLRSSSANKKEVR